MLRDETFDGETVVDGGAPPGFGVDTAAATPPADARIGDTALLLLIVAERMAFDAQAARAHSSNERL